MVSDSTQHLASRLRTPRAYLQLSDLLACEQWSTRLSRTTCAQSRVRACAAVSEHVMSAPQSHSCASLDLQAPRAAALLLLAGSIQVRPRDDAEAAVACMHVVQCHPDGDVGRALRAGLPVGIPVPAECARRAWWLGNVLWKAWSQQWHAKKRELQASDTLPGRCRGIQGRPGSPSQAVSASSGRPPTLPALGLGAPACTRAGAQLGCWGCRAAGCTRCGTIG